MSSSTLNCPSVRDSRSGHVTSVPEPWWARLTALSDCGVIALSASVLFVLAAWPLLLVDLPPFQDLPNHVATAHIVAHPGTYPEYAFNGLIKSNGLLTLWFFLTGSHGLFAAARAFAALVLAVTAVALPLFVLHFAGRRHVGAALLFAWPLVHSFSVSMGFLNFAFAFALALLLVVALDRQRMAPSRAGATSIGALALATWFAHPFPLVVIAGLVTAHVAGQTTWRQRVHAARTLIFPLTPAGLVTLVTVHHHFFKLPRVPTATVPLYSFLNPWNNLAHLWTDVSGAFTLLGSTTIIPAVLLPWFAWRQRTREYPLLSTTALRALGGAYVMLPVMLSNWWYLNCRVVPFLWAGCLLRLPSRVPRPVVAMLVGAAVAFSVATGVDYVRLDRDRAEFTAGLGVVPSGATLLPLMFKRSKTSTFTASLSHAWAYYTVLKNASAPLVFAVERSYPITYRKYPPPVLAYPAVERWAESYGTAAQVCSGLARAAGDSTCRAELRQLWGAFWREAEPRFGHVLTWAMPPEARSLLPASYRRVFAEGDLEIYARGW